jgi:hypothetical protein
MRDAGTVDKTRAGRDTATSRTCRITRLKRILQTGQDVIAMRIIGVCRPYHPATGVIRPSVKTR